MPFLDREGDLWRELSSLSSDEGLRLYDAESPSPKLLRVVVDKVVVDRVVADRAERAVAGSAVTSKDCSRLCRRLIIFFAGEGEKFGVSEEVELEVSSPGVNRSLRTAEHYQGAIGERVKVVTQGGSKDKSVIIGDLESATDSEITVVDEAIGQQRSLPLCDITRANVDFKW